MNAAILNKHDQVVFSAELDETTAFVVVVESISAEGAPTNPHAYRVSRAEQNLRRAHRDQRVAPIVQREYRGQAFWTIDRASTADGG